MPPVGRQGFDRQERIKRDLGAHAPVEGNEGGGDHDPRTAPRRSSETRGIETTMSSALGRACDMTGTV